MENSYGIQKRLKFVAEAIACRNSKRVLDVGCGTGANLTAPLAVMFPAVQFVGVDSDRRSIEFAAGGNRNQNARYCGPEDLRGDEKFDMVIASEVIEHVESPREFLKDLRARVSGRGVIILTLPNGYGSYELAAKVESLLRWSGIYGAARWLLRSLRCLPAAQGQADTLAVSPHINFFTFRRIQGVISESGLSVEAYRPRSVFCGFGFDMLIRGELLTRWNLSLADKLPPFAAADWMFILGVDGQSKSTGGT